MERDTRRLALASVCLGILAVTLLPVRAGWSDGFHAGSLRSALASLVENLRHADFPDVVQNLLLFLPLGVLLGLAPGAAGSTRRTVASAALAGLVLSGLVEWAQVWVPGRFPSVLDILLNGAGSGLGAWVSLRFLMGFMGSAAGVKNPDN